MLQVEVKPSNEVVFEIEGVREDLMALCLALRPGTPRRTSEQANLLTQFAVLIESSDLALAEMCAEERESAQTRRARRPRSRPEDAHEDPSSAATVEQPSPFGVG